MIRGVKFTCIPVSDQERALAFYMEKLEFRLLADLPFSDEQRWLELGIPGAETRIVLFRSGDEMKPGGRSPVTFWTDDVEATVRGLKRKGVVIVKEPERAAWGTAAAFQDPDGNTFVLSTR